MCLTTSCSSGPATWCQQHKLIKCSTGWPDGPEVSNNVVTERKWINISLGQYHECMLLFTPHVCKLPLSYLRGSEKNAFVRSIASCHLPESLIKIPLPTRSCNWLYYLVKFAVVHCFFPGPRWVFAGPLPRHPSNLWRCYLSAISSKHVIIVLYLLSLHLLSITFTNMWSLFYIYYLGWVGPSFRGFHLVFITIITAFISQGTSIRVSPTV